MLDLKRRNDWRSRLSNELEKQRRFDLNYGERDCFLTIVCGTVKALTGYDLASDYAGLYDSLESAEAGLKERGFEDLMSFTGSLFPRYEHHSQAQVGDVGLIKDDSILGYAYCVVDASGIIVLADGGHGRRPREDMVVAYKVG